MSASMSLLAWMGDSRLLLPVMLALGACWWRRDRRIGRDWFVLLALLCGSLVVSKLAYKAGGLDWRTIGFFTISGHAAMSGMLYPLLGHALAGDVRPGVRRCAVGLGVLIALVVAVARVLSRHHTLAEIVVGLAFGLALAAAMLWRWRTALLLPLRTRSWVVGTALAAALVVWLVPTVSAERVLSHIAWRIRS